MTASNNDILDKTKGIVKKKTLKGTRYLLHDKDLQGRDIYATIDITDKTPVKDYTEKINQARIKLNSKKNASSFQDLVDEYISSRQLKKGSADNLRRVMRGFGFDNEQNQKAINSILTKPTKQTTKNMKILLVRGFFRWIIVNGKASTTDPTQGIRVKHAQSVRDRILTKDEIPILFEKMKSLRPIDQLVIRLAYFTGARISSIYALEKKSLKNGCLYYYNVKTSRPYRYPIPLKDKETVKLFYAHIDEMRSETIGTKNARINRFLRKIFDIVDGDSISIHSLRHTFASRAIQAGIAPDIVSRLLDHENLSTTMRIYAKHSQGQINDAIDRIF